MKELFRERDITKVSFYQALLEDAGIATFIKNENLSTSEGVLMPDFFPALCIVNDEDFLRSAAIIQAHLKETDLPSNVELICGNCGEASPGNFGNCWNCGAPLVAPA